MSFFYKWACGLSCIETIAGFNNCLKTFCRQRKNPPAQHIERKESWVEGFISNRSFVMGLRISSSWLCPLLAVFFSYCTKYLALFAYFRPSISIFLKHFSSIASDFSSCTHLSVILVSLMLSFLSYLSLPRISLWYPSGSLSLIAFCSWAQNPWPSNASSRLICLRLLSSSGHYGFLICFLIPCVDNRSQPWKYY